MAGERVDELARLGIPELDRVIGTATGEDQPIGTQCHAANTICMAGERAEKLTRLDIPELDRMICTPRRDAGAVRRERD